MPVARTIGWVSAGVQLDMNSGLTMRLQYQGAFSHRGHGHGGFLKLGMPF